MVNEQSEINSVFVAIRVCVVVPARGENRLGPQREGAEAGRLQGLRPLTQGLGQVRGPNDLPWGATPAEEQLPAPKAEAQGPRHSGSHATSPHSRH